MWPRPRGHRGTEASGRRPPHAEKRERVTTVPCTHGGERAAWPGSARVLTWENAPALLVSGAFHRTELRSCSHCWEGDPPVTGPPDSGVFRQLGDSFNAELFFFLFFLIMALVKINQKWRSMLVLQPRRPEQTHRAGGGGWR